MLDQELGELGIIARGLTADADLAILGARGCDDAGDHLFHSGVSFVENLGHDFAVAIDTENELRQVIRADAEAIKDFGEFFGQNDVARNFAHHVNFKPILAALEAMLLHLGDDFAAFVDRAAERDHQFYIR